MDFINRNKKTLVCVLVVAVAVTALYMLSKMRENFDSSYFKNPSNPSIENKLESTIGMGKGTLMIVCAILGVLILGGALYFFMNKNKNTSLPELSDTSEPSED